MKKILILGTAPDANVLASLDQIRADEPNAQLFLMVAKARSERFQRDDLTIIPITGMVKWNQLKLFLAYQRIKPQRVVVLRGEHWFHDNVIHAVRLWSLGRSTEITCMRAAMYSGMNYPNAESPLIVSAVAGFFLAALLAPWLFPSYGWLLPGGIIFAELCFKAFNNMYSHMAPRYRNYRPLTTLNLMIKSQLQTMQHARLGWINIPFFSFRHTLDCDDIEPSHYSWEAQHDQDGCRISTNHPDRYRNNPKIAVFGCSITYGFCVEQDQAYPWLLQQYFDKYCIVNQGVGAWSTYQIYLKLKDYLQHHKPAAVVLGFHQELELRNTNSFPHRTHWLNNFENPACLVKHGKCYESPPRGFRHLPFSDWIWVIAMIEYGINRLRFAGRSNPRLMRETNQYLLMCIKRLCEQHQTPLLVTCVESSEKYFHFFKENGFSWCISGVTSTEKLKWTLSPFDGHPNARAHRQIAEVTRDALEKVLENRHVTPDAQLLTDQIPDPEDCSELRFIYPQF